MDPAALATSLMTMKAAGIQMQANVAVLKQRFAMQKSVIDILDPANSRPPAPAGMGTRVDKTA